MIDFNASSCFHLEEERYLKKFKRWIGYVFLGSAILLVLCVILLFTTSKGHQLRLIAAEVILSSQHRDLVKLTFLSEDEINTILKNIQNPTYLNSHSSNLSHTIIDSIDSGASYKSSSERLHDLYASMVSEREGLQEANNIALEKTKNTKLILRIDDIQERYSDHFFKGKLLTVSNPNNIRLALSEGEQVNAHYGEQIHVIAKREKAIAATNASGFSDPNGVGNGGTPLGIVMHEGNVTTASKGKNKKDYIAGLTNEGLLVTGYYSPSELTELSIQYAAGFKPQLISDGKKMIVEGNGGWGYGPRTAIGQKADGSILLIVVDGRQANSIGASMKDIQDILFDHGVVNAMAMDGGSSAIMHINGQNVTTPSSVNNVPRYIPNAWVVIPQKNQQVEIYENDVLSKSYTNK